MFLINLILKDLFHLNYQRVRLNFIMITIT
jgi:hypothetical protein